MLTQVVSESENNVNERLNPLQKGHIEMELAIENNIFSDGNFKSATELATENRSHNMDRHWGFSNWNLGFVTRWRRKWTSVAICDGFSDTLNPSLMAINAHFHRHLLHFFKKIHYLWPIRRNAKSVADSGRCPFPSPSTPFFKKNPLSVTYLSLTFGFLK